MDLLRRLITLVNRPTDEQAFLNGNTSIPGYYLGQTYAAQPNSDELRRAAYILTTKTKKDIDRNALPILACCFEGSHVLIRDGRKHKCVEFEVRKIVVSCVDAKNQRLLAIFYHNDSPYIAGPMTTRGLECHLFLCRNKDVAKAAANKIGEMLSEQYKQPQRPNIDIDDGQVRLSRVVPVDDYDYENISKFFRQKVFKNGHDYQNNSMFSTPCGSLSTCVTTTGCDSGRASTVASFDIRSDESLRSSTCGPINENDEFDSKPSGFGSNSSLSVPIRTASGTRTRWSKTPYTDRLNSPETPNDTSNTTENQVVYKNRYSVHYDLEDDVIQDQNEVKITLDNGVDTPYILEDISDGELERLMGLSETDI